MEFEKLKELLSKHGQIEVIKDGYVFTLLMTGKQLSKWTTVSEIQENVLKYLGGKFPNIEVMRNEKEYFCLVLRK